MTISKKAEDFNLLVVRNIVDNFSQRDDNKKGVHSFIYKLTHKNYRCNVKSVTYVSVANVSETHTCCPASREDAVRIRNPKMTADALKR